jgi:ornithine cyclodeaminase/alanine dehydrogenase
MALLLRDSETTAVASPSLAVGAIHDALQLEFHGRAETPARLTAGPQNSWLRLMPGFLHSHDGQGAMGFKAMNVNGRTGGRYVIFLYDLDSGDLLAIIDAKHLTRLRTAAVTTVASLLLGPSQVTEIGLFGSGHEAYSHLETFNAIHESLERVIVYSPTRRHSFAQRASEALGLDVIATNEPQLAAGLPVVVVATKSQVPVLEANWLQPETLVLSIGSTRLDLRELPEAVFSRADLVVGDAPEQLATESGDVAAAIRAGFLSQEQVVSLSELATNSRKASWPPSDLAVFKSVGTAIQDLAVAEAVYRTCCEQRLGVELEGFPA